MCPPGHYRPPLPVTTLQAIVNEADRVPAYLPKVLALKQALLDAQDWIGLVETMQVCMLRLVPLIFGFPVKCIHVRLMLLKQI